MRTILFTHGEYSDYSVLGVLEVPDDFNLDQARKEFMDIAAPVVPYDPAYTYYERMYEAEKQAEKQFADYENNWSRDAMFVQWLVKEKKLKEVSYKEINLDYDLKLWEQDR